jgi:hypothetical protein
MLCHMAFSINSQQKALRDNISVRLLLSMMAGDLGHRGGAPRVVDVPTFAQLSAEARSMVDELEVPKSVLLPRSAR